MRAAELSIRKVPGPARRSVILRGTHALRSQARFAQGTATEGSIQLLVVRPKVRILRKLRMTCTLGRPVSIYGTVPVGVIRPKSASAAACRWTGRSP